MRGSAAIASSLVGSGVSLHIVGRLLGRSGQIRALVYSRIIAGSKVRHQMIAGNGIMPDKTTAFDPKQTSEFIRRIQNLAAKQTLGDRLRWAKKKRHSNRAVDCPHSIQKRICFYPNILDIIIFKYRYKLERSHAAAQQLSTPWGT